MVNPREWLRRTLIASGDAHEFEVDAVIDGMLEECPDLLRQMEQIAQEAVQKARREYFAERAVDGLGLGD